MPIKVQCPGCQSSFNVKDEMAGKKLRCPKCKSPMSVPGGSAPEAGAGKKQSPAADKTTNRTTRRNFPQRQEPVSAPSERNTVTDQTATIRLTAVTCPECGKTIPKGEVSCPNCRYHLKLKRRIGISSAIHSANMHSQGLNRDGSKKVTRADESAERVDKEKRVGLVLGLCCAVIVLAVAAYFVNMVLSSYGNSTVVQLRERGEPDPLVAQDPATYDPRWISVGDETITLRLPVDTIYKLNPEFSGEWPQGSKGIARFMQTIMAPVAAPQPQQLRFDRKDAEAIRMRANELGGSFAPAELEVAPFGGAIYAWRQGAKAQDRGFLRGALLDFATSAVAQEQFSAAQRAYEQLRNVREMKIQRKIRSDKSFGIDTPREEVEAKYPEPQAPEIEITGALSFVPFYDHDMNGTFGSYRNSAQEKAPAVRNPDNNDRVRDEKDLPKMDLAYFAPVIIVQKARLIKK